MNHVIAQVGFFRDIQRAFGRGVDADVLVAVLVKFVLIAGPLVAVFVVWRNWDRVHFFLLRARNMRKYGPVRARIAKHLKSGNVPLEVFLMKNKVQQFLGRAMVGKAGLKRMQLAFTSDVPNALARVIAGKHIICYCRPFKVGGQRVNSFHSFVIETTPGVSGIKSALIYTPADYVHTIRRSSPRKRLAKPGAVRVRLWGAAKKDKFMVLAPDFETDQKTGNASWKAANRVVNISAGGLKLELHPTGRQQLPRINEQVVLELMVLNPAKKSFSQFFMTGAVRNIARPPSGAVYLGIQFTAQGERTGSRSVKWNSVRGDVPELEKLLGG